MTTFVKESLRLINLLKPTGYLHKQVWRLRIVELVRNLVAHGDAREGKWRWNWRMEWVASTLTPPPNVVYPALLKLMRTPRLPAVDWTDAPTNLNGLVRFWERRNLVSARVPSRFARAIRSAPTVFICIVFMLEQTATSAPYNINWLVFITEMESVYCAVRTGSLNNVVCVSSLKG